MKNRKLSTVKKIVIISLTALAVISAIIIAFLDDFIPYDYYPGSWNYDYGSHIGDISQQDQYGNPLPIIDDYNGNKYAARWFQFGGAEWYSNVISNDIKTNANKDFGSLIRLYSYYDDNINHKYFGENAVLWVYDIEPKYIDLGITRDSLYTLLYKTYSKDTTNYWKPTKAFEPFLALTGGPGYTMSADDDTGKFVEQIILFANDRVYSFHITNDKIEFGKDVFQAFEERCFEIVRNIDFSKYRELEIDNYNNQILEMEMIKWRRILLSIIFLCMSLVFIMPIQKLGNRNIQARNLFIYGTICFVISIVICLGVVWLSEPFYGINANAEYMRAALAAIGIGLLYAFMMAFLSYRSNEEYYKEYLIPSWVINKFNISSAVSKRILLVVLFFPLFYLFPIPIFGIYILFYIFPISVIALIILGLKWIVDGRKVQDSSVVNPRVANPQKVNPQATNNAPLINKETPKMYCRHCGEIIDADSGFCRYCGKKIK
ncbi:hypothetical protein [Methanobrevibacter sp.]|uniref:hypothetical protein n=1 Tax=Methanobrevibacter sp. TaxID=66852 RepID=UPI00386A1CCF